VSLPADAQLWVNNRLTISSGAVREFRDSHARPGEFYRYELRASVERNGQSLSQLRVARLRGGESSHIVFDFPRPIAALKPTDTSGEPPADNLLAQNSVFQRSQFQTRPTQDPDLPALPTQDQPAVDGFQPRSSEPSDPTDAGSQLELPQLPELDDPTNDPRFGRQFGEEPDNQPPLTDDPAIPPVDSGTDELPLDETPKSVMNYQGETDKGAAGDASQVASPGALYAAYIGHHQQHHLIGNTGTTLHVWRHRWRMVNLEHSGTAGAYDLYEETAHRGCLWAFGLHPFFCDRFPVFFRPGANARWCFMGYTNRVRPFSN
jgi:uncharacterized protein (TIGR03000 family)